MQYSGLYFPDEFLQRYDGIYVEHTSTTKEMSVAKCSQMLLVYVAHGYGCAVINNKEHSIAENDVILISDNTPYLFRSGSNRSVSMYVCVFDKKTALPNYRGFVDSFKRILDFSGRASSYIIIPDTEHKDIRNQMIGLIDEFSLGRDGFRYALTAHLTLALTSIFRLYSAASRSERQTPDNYQNINLIMGYMYNYAQRHIYTKTSLTELVDLLHLTPQYLCTVFKKNAGMTFTEYVNRLRVDKIKDALENTGRPVYIITDDFDFSHQYLNRLFKRYTGYNLNDYKNRFNYKKNNPLYPQ